MDASIVESLRIGSARNRRPAGNREVPRVGHRRQRPRSSGCRSWPVGELWSACPLPWLRCARLRPLGRLDGLPARDHCGESDLPARGAKGRHLCPPPWRTSAEKGGVALTTSTPLVRRAVAPGGRGTREAQLRFAFPQRTREIRVVPRLVRRFGKVPHHNGEGSAL